jgi:hypothetical protein
MAKPEVTGGIPMKAPMSSVLLQACFPLVALAAAATARSDGDDLQPGSLAPPHALQSWIQGEMRELAELRGRVVVLHTFAWNCDSCLRKGIPLSVELGRANAPEDLQVLSITTPAERENTLKVVKDFGATQPIAAENPMGGTCPYVDMANGITYMWVIGRNGEIVWRGDPSTKEEECLEAVRMALADRSDRALGRDVHPALAEAAGHFAAGAYGDAREAADKLAKEHARGKDAEAQAIAADAAYLTGRVDSRLAELTAALEQAVEARDADAFVAQRTELIRGFPKRDAEAAMKAADPALDDPAFKSAVAEAEAWLTLKYARPALYGVRHDKSAERYVASLKKFLQENPKTPHAEEAQRLVALDKPAETGAR